MATCCTSVLVAIWQVAALFWCFYLSGMLGSIQESCRLTGLALAGRLLAHWPLEYKQNTKLLRFLSVITKCHIQVNCNFIIDYFLLLTVKVKRTALLSGDIIPSAVTTPAACALKEPGRIQVTREVLE